MEPKAQFLADALHAAIVGQNVSRDASYFVLTSNLEQSLQQLDASSVAFKLVADDNGKFGFLGSIQIGSSAISLS